MNKILLAIVAASMVVSPAMAEDRHHSNRNSWVLPLVGGLIVGGLIVSEHDRHKDQQPPDPRYQPQQYQPQPPYYSTPQPRYFYEDGMRCVDTPHVAYDQYGYQYYVWERFCR